MATEFAGLLAHKRHGGRWTPAQLDLLARGLADGGLDEAQAGALAMAACCVGLDDGETRALTAAMRDSGTVLDWAALGLQRPMLDKHSTGGVGDCLSLVLAPALAACGAAVPMLSGRGLGHTGGTLDKLEALPGYRADQPLSAVVDCVRRHGLAIVAAGPELAPADRRLYDVRDRSGTVDALPLIVSSILSKKLAAGVRHLLLDVKLGSGALLPDRAAAEALGQALLDTARGLGLSCTVALTDMDQPLADAAGNALELAACARLLRGEDSDSRLYRLCLQLGARLLVEGGLAAEPALAASMLRRALCSGAAAERFEAMVATLGGPRDCLRRERDWQLPAPCVGELLAGSEGWLGAIDTRRLGEACVLLGAGRGRAGARIDPQVGLSAVLPLGSRVQAGQPLLRIHAASPEALAQARVNLASAFHVQPQPSTAPPLVHAWLEAPRQEQAA